MAVTLIALVVFAVLTVWGEHRDVAGLASSQRAQATHAIVSASASAYRANGGWSGADLQPVVALAAMSSSATELTRPDGAVLLRTGNLSLLAESTALRISRSVVDGGVVVGRLQLAFPAGGLSRPEQRLFARLAEAAALTALVVVLIALVASLGLTRVAVRPIQRLAVAANAIRAGDRNVRIGPNAGPGEIGELGEAFDGMAMALEQAERSRHALIAEIAHELRTPVAILQGETEALIDGVRTPTPEALTSLHEEAIRLGQRIADLQALASADAAGLSMERSVVDLAAIAGHAADLLAAQFNAAGVRLERFLSPTPVWADAHRLHQVVTNLLTNACKFSSTGTGVRLNVHVNGNDGVLCVTDEGPGVPAEEVDHIFERFYRGEAGRRAGGSGIGLAVVDRIVRAHDGDISFVTPSNGGACFVVRLPAAAGTPEPAGLVDS